MNIEKSTVKKILFILTFGIILFWGINHFDTVSDLLSKLFGYIFPFILGACIAFLLNIPMKVIEKYLILVFQKIRKGRSLSASVVRPLSILLTLLFILSILLGVILIIIPQIESTALSIKAALPGFTKNLQVFTEAIALKLPDVAIQLDALGINWQNLGKSLSNILQSFGGTVIDSSLSIATSVFSGVVNFFLGTIFAFYILSSKEKLIRQMHLIMKAYLPTKKREKLHYIGGLTNRTFSNFFTGQCTEAIILGCMFFVGMTLFNFPYAVMISVVIGFTSLIPIFGAFIGCIIGAFFILVTEPIRALWFIIFFLVIQQIEGNFIYPKVVGGSVGLPPMWVLVAVTLGGSMMGIIGMLVFIPITSVLYTLLRDSVYSRLNQKG